MQGIINNRFIGTLILVIAAIILLPSILDGEKQGSPQRFKTIPKQPELQPIEEVPAFDSSAIDERFADINAVEENVHAVDDTEMASAQSDSIAPKDTVNQTNHETNNLPETVLVTETIQVAKVKPVSFSGEKASTPESTESSTTNENVSVVKKAQFESQAWVIQLGAFRNTANVQSLKSKLNKAGYVVITEQIKVRSGVLTKVYVGPEIDRAMLEKALPELTKLTKLAGKITKYQP